MPQYRNGSESAPEGKALRAAAPYPFAPADPCSEVPAKAATCAGENYLRAPICITDSASAAAPPSSPRPPTVPAVSCRRRLYSHPPTDHHL